MLLIKLALRDHITVLSRALEPRDCDIVIVADEANLNRLTGDL